MSFEEIAGVRVKVDSCGSGIPTLIFAHGGACDRHDWNAQREGLGDRFRVVTVDLPGHGESDPPAAATIEALGRVIAALNFRYGRGEAILVGHSMGCRVILEAYRQAPAGVVGFVFVDGSYFADEGVADQTKKSVRLTGVESFLDRIFDQMFLPTSDPEFRRKAIARTKGWNIEFLFSMIRWDARDLKRVLATTSMPVLLLQSSYLDELFNRQSLSPSMRTPWMDLVALLVPHAEICVIPGVGHFPQIEAAECVNDLIANFAQRRAQSRPQRP